MTFAALQPLADRAALFTALRQDSLVTALEALGDHRWDADMAAGSLTFTSNDDPSRQLATRAHLVATIAPGPRSLLWAWAHPQGDPDGVAAQLRDYGTEHGIAELSETELAFPDDAAGDAEWITAAAHTVGTSAVFLLDAPIPPLTVASAAIALPRVLSELALTDARTSVWDAARLAGWNLTWTDESFSGATITDATGSATFHFDEQARITNIESSLHAQG
jgi:hypothetical protein